MQNNTIENYILDYSMKKIPDISLNETKITGFKHVNFMVVNSKFKVEFKLPYISLNKWKKTYKEINDFFKIRDEHITRFIIVSDSDTDNSVLYINKIK